MLGIGGSGTSVVVISMAAQLKTRSAGILGYGKSSGRLRILAQIC
jgi:hypothetical protein